MIVMTAKDKEKAMLMSSYDFFKFKAQEMDLLPDNDMFPLPLLRSDSTVVYDGIVVETPNAKTIRLENAEISIKILNKQIKNI